MRSLLIVSVAASTLLASASRPAQACGDKLLMLGRGIRFQSRHTPRPAAVLLYLPAQPQRAGALTDPKLESALREAGHKLRTAVTREELQQAAKTGEFDVLVADIGDATGLAESIAEGGPIVLPVVYLLAPASASQPKLDAARAKKTYRVVLRVPGRAGHYCAAVDDAMELKLKRDRAKKPSASL